MNQKKKKDQCEKEAPTQPEEGFKKATSLPTSDLHSHTYHRQEPCTRSQSKPPTLTSNARKQASLLVLRSNQGLRSLTQEGVRFFFHQLKKWCLIVSEDVHFLQVIFGKSRMEYDNVGETTEF